jgi:CHAT domain-containing protein/tetratricopeptide (TPR) repeat protein
MFSKLWKRVSGQSDDKVLQQPGSGESSDAAEDAPPSFSVPTDNVRTPTKELEALVADLFARGEDEEAAEYVPLLAEQYMLSGDYAAAEPLCKQALAIGRAKYGNHHLLLASILNDMALLYYLKGDYATAEPLYKEATEIVRAALGEKHEIFAKCLANLGLLYTSMNNYAAAEPLHRQALEIRRIAIGEQHPDFAGSLHNLAMLYDAMGKSAAAVRLYKEAIEVKRKVLGELHPSLASSLDNLGSLCRSIGSYTAAEQLCRQALEIRRSALGEKHAEFGASLHNLATLSDAIGNYDAAEKLYEQAIEIKRAVLGEHHPDVALSLHNLAVVFVATGREAAARELMELALAIQDQIMGQVFSISSEKERAAYLNSVRSRLDIFLSLVTQHVAASPEAVQSVLSLVLRRKALEAEALAMQRDAVLSGKYPAVAPTLREITTLRAQIAQRTLAGPGREGLQAHLQYLAERNAQKDRLESEVARQVPEMNIEQKLRSVDHQVVAMAMPVGTTLVEFVRFDVADFKAVPAHGESQWKPARYLAFAMPAGEPDNVTMIDLGEAEPIDRMIATFRSVITGEEDESGKRGLGALPASARRTEGEDVGLRLREAIFDPLLKAIGDRRRLLISPDGDLARLPFEVLPANDGRRLIDDYRISYLGAGRDVVRFDFKSNRKPTRSLVAADPDFDLGAQAMRADGAGGAGRRSCDLKREKMGTFERLPGTRREGENIAALLDAELWTGGAALDARLKQCQSPRILHLATHGFFLEDQKRDPNDEQLGFGSMSLSESGMQRLADARFENPLLRSGLALAGANTWLEKGELMEEAEDGLLTAEDVSGLDLIDTELVVLSACDTGLGEVRVGEGVFGLRRAFVLAGAKTLVMSLWKVPDEQTRELMEDFYCRILKGESRADALRAAQLAMKAKHPEPFYWGSFICQGYDGPLAAS